MIQSLFPIPIGLYDLDKSFIKSELNYFDSLELRNSLTNKISIDSNILTDKKMNRIEKFCNNSIKDYIKNTYDLEEDVKLYITQSWLNLTLPSEFHHRHSHPNSIVSGVLFIDVDEEKDKIQFYNNSLLYRGGAFHFDCISNNDFNSESWWMPSITGRLYIFPSGLQHDVPADNTREKERVSLSFNTFLTGNIGDEIQMTKLVL